MLTFWPLLLYHFRREYWQAGSYLYHIVIWATENTDDMDLLASILSLSFDTLFILQAWGGYLFSLHLNLTFMHTFKTTISTILTTSFNRNVSKLKVLQGHMFIYSKLRILTSIFNNVFGMRYIPSMKTFCGLMISGAVFISVRLAPKSNFLVGIFGVTMAVLGIICLVMFILFTAMVNEYSVRFGEYLKKGAFQGKLGRRIVRSFREEAVRSGEYYKIKRITCITVLGMISNMCGSMLISVKF